jgi:hypothetical protein
MEKRTIEIIDNQRVRLAEIALKFNEIINLELRCLDELKVNMMKKEKNSIRIPSIESEEIIDQAVILNRKEEK